MVDFTGELGLDPCCHVTADLESWLRAQCECLPTPRFLTAFEMTGRRAFDWGKDDEDA